MVNQTITGLRWKFPDMRVRKTHQGFSLMEVMIGISLSTALMSGIVQLMEDLGSALNENPDMIFMGGGNPGRLTEVEAIFQQRLEQIMADPGQRHSLFGI